MSSRPSLPGMFDGASRVGILHHWDADGISSTAQILAWAGRQGAECYNTTPPIGIYDDCRQQASSLVDREPDLALGLDLSVSRPTLEAIAGLSPAELAWAWIDHHSKPPEPPEGITLFHPTVLGQANPWSNSWFLAGLLGDGPGLAAAIGVCGDIGQEVLSGPARDAVRPIADSCGISVQQLLQITDLIDSNYRAENRQRVQSAPDILAERLDNPKELLLVDEWKASKADVDRELERVMDSAEEIRSGVLVKTINSTMHLTSAVARRAAYSGKGSVKAVIVRNLARPEAPFYVRRVDPTLDLTPLIELARPLCRSVGGKPEVVGMILPRDRTSRLTDLVLGFLGDGS